MNDILKLHTGIRKLTGILYPPRCVVCDGLLEQEQNGMHEGCRKMLYPVKEPVCMHCGRPVPRMQDEYCFDCGRKQKEREAHGKHDIKETGSANTFIQGKSLYLYQGEAKKIMYRFKYSNRREYAVFFAQEAAARYGTWLEEHGVEAIVPVPMYPKKEQKRGYNQAEIFARELSLMTGIPLWKGVKRIRDTVPQKELNDIARKNNLKNAFQIHENIVEYRYILLVDDIYTTGSTADAVTEVLYQAGAEYIYILSICIGKGF